MTRKNLKLRVDDEGRLEVVDPGYDTLDLIHAIDPAFEIKSAPLPLFSSPRFLKARKWGCGLTSKKLKKLSNEKLWDLHNHLLDSLPTEDQARQTDEASFLDLKIELAYRVLKSCRLCSRQCAVNRTAGERGACGLGMEATVFEHFVHIAEEPPVNPSLNLFLAGCGLKCCFCQQEHLLDPASVHGNRLYPTFWKRLRKKGARTMSFIGGNPDESLYAILRFFSDAPARWALPIVWNCSGYASASTIKLLHGVVDAYIPDYKFGCGPCGEELAQAANYWASARIAVSGMLEQTVPVIVRLLVLPGHFDCCQKPILDFLSRQRARVNLFVSIRGQYAPEASMKQSLREAMYRRATMEEVSHIARYAEALHVNIIAPVLT